MVISQKQVCIYGTNLLKGCFIIFITVSARDKREKKGTVVKYVVKSKCFPL